MIKDIELSFLAASALSAQMWKYYDIDCDVLTSGTKLGSCEYKIWAETEGGLQTYHVKFKLFEHTVENLYLSRMGEYIEPTTTREEQEAR
jgi:hypothetical protein